MNSDLKLRSCLALLLITTLGSCGGGSQGTGTHSVQIVGRLLRQDTTSIRGASVTLEQTGDATKTDKDGGFLLRARGVTGNVSALFETESESFSSPLGDIDSSTKTLKTEVVAPERNLDGSQSKPSRHLTVKPSVRGMFTDKKIFGVEKGNFVQLLPIPPELGSNPEFTFSLTYYNSDVALERKKVIAEVRSCKRPQWRRVAEDLLNGDEDQPGRWKAFASINIRPYRDDIDNCIYRITGPYGVDHLSPLTTTIFTHTFRTQWRQRSNNNKRTKRARKR